MKAAATLQPLQANQPLPGLLDQPSPPPPLFNSKKLAAELSERIAMLRLPLIIGVVFIHAYDPRLGKATELRYLGWSGFVCDYLSVSLASVAVPLLFLFSGYLFFVGFSPSSSSFSAQAGKRARTLLIPHLFWNTLCLTITGIAQSLPAATPYFSGRSAPVTSFRFFDYANALLGLTKDPIAFQFWFVRDLMLLVLLSPLVYFLLKRAPVPFLVVLLLWWSSGKAYSLPILSREAVLFFSAGSVLAIRHIDLRAFDKIAVYAWLYAPLSLADTISRHQAANHFVHSVAEMGGVVFVICATRYVWRLPVSRKILIALSPASFFVFAAHEPLLTVTRKLSYRLLPPAGSAGVASLYFGDTMLVIVFCTAVYYLCAQTMPGLTAIITGGRATTA
jgi:surface polysaccharide O-acyltransferase-like enzyme